jgi:glycine cleavage system H protein
MDLLEIVAKESPQIAIIMMTGYTTEENAITSLQKGAFDFLPKPFAFEELLATVRRADRFVKLSMASRRTQLNESARNYYRLGMHSWAKLGADGTAQLGVTDIFQKTVGMIRQIELPAVNDEIRQGGLLAQIVAADQMKHAAWAALSGRVLESNHNAEQNPTSLNLDPFGSGWLVRIIPINLEDELNHLSKA